MAMFSSILRPRSRRPRISVSHPNLSSPLLQSGRRNGYRAAEEESMDRESEDAQDDDGPSNQYGDENYEEEDQDDEDENGRNGAAPILPLFSAPHLDSLPVYHLTRDIRLLVTSRCETTLSWEQLRSPQVSQFVLKPILQTIQASHLSRATLYALLANCLQFSKEVDLKPGLSGASKTRAMVCELLAIKLLKEYPTRELIDALSYDFLPLQSRTPPPSSGKMPGGPNAPAATAAATAARNAGWSDPQVNQGQRQLRAVRISCLEIAIRAQAKRFLAHPLVVQHLEAIWAGTIVFHSAADSLHRQPLPRDSVNLPKTGYRSIPEHRAAAGKIDNVSLFRRSVTLYDPRYASLFKLSRLRVPRYRQFLSTLSFAILLGLFLAVINQRSLNLTTLEVIFWLWSAGFMLDEIVGFNEQGFSLYLMSFWNTFDVGILLLLVCYYGLRIYSVITAHPHDKEMANLAYDVLAASAVLLLPRLFSVLDHYRYFSQLLIAFRMMLADLFAVLILIIIACSGFFVAFTSSFTATDNSPASIAYALFQVLMGFTPAAWDLWEDYNMLGKAILTLFLFICHFLVVTILITVLTNSFMSIVLNSNEEHQFVFAVNTISMVKSDALFSYVAPTNLLAWAIAPLRFIMPFRLFIRLNRTTIKITHFPILFSIYLYERVVLRSALFEPTDLVEGSLRPAPAGHWPEPHQNLHHFDNGHRARDPSIATHQKDRALEEVFRGTLGQGRQHDQKTSNKINTWMQDVGSELAPEEQDRDDVDDLERGNTWRTRSHARRPYLARMHRNNTETTRSVASDPEEYPGKARDLLHPHLPHRPRNLLSPDALRHSATQHTDVDGDDELSTNDESSNKSKRTRSMASSSYTSNDRHRPVPVEQWSSTTAPVFEVSRPSTAKMASRRNSPSRRPKTPHRPRHHIRTHSSATVLYNPVDRPSGSSDVSRDSPKHNRSPRIRSGQTTPNRARQPKGSNLPANPSSKPRAIPFPKSAVDLPSALSLDGRSHKNLHHYPSLAMGLGSDLGDNKAVGGGFVGGLPASFTTQMAHANRPHGLGHPSGPRAIGGDGNTVHDSRDMLSKLVLARMKTLEESFQEVVKEVKDLRRPPQQREQQLASRHAQGQNAGEKERPKSRPEMPRRKSDREVTLARAEMKRRSDIVASSKPDIGITGLGDDVDAELHNDDDDNTSEFKASSV